MYITNVNENFIDFNHVNQSKSINFINFYTCNIISIFILTMDYQYQNHKAIKAFIHANIFSLLV